MFSRRAALSGGGSILLLIASLSGCLGPAEQERPAEAPTKDYDLTHIPIIFHDHVPRLRATPIDGAACLEGSDTWQLAFSVYARSGLVERVHASGLAGTSQNIPLPTLGSPPYLLVRDPTLCQGVSVPLHRQSAVTLLGPDSDHPSVEATYEVNVTVPLSKDRATAQWVPPEEVLRLVSVRATQGPGQEVMVYAPDGRVVLEQDDQTTSLDIRPLEEGPFEIVVREMPVGAERQVTITFMTESLPGTVCALGFAWSSCH